MATYLLDCCEVMSKDQSASGSHGGLRTRAASPRHILLARTTYINLAGLGGIIFMPGHLASVGLVYELLKMLRTWGNHGKPNGRELLLDHEGEAICEAQSFSASLASKTDDGNRKMHLPPP